MFDRGSISDQRNRPSMINPSLGSGVIPFNSMFPFGYHFLAIFGKDCGRLNNGRDRYNNSDNRPTYHLHGKQGHTVTEC